MKRIYSCRSFSCTMSFKKLQQVNRSCSLYETLSITVAVLRHLRIRKSFMSEVWISKTDVVMMVPSEL